jgi:uncharacterized protein (TIGR02271 family)
MDTTSTATRRTVTALFDDRSAAERAVENLVSQGVPRDQIRLVPGAESSSAARQPDDNKGFWEALGDFFLPEEDRYTYAEGLRRGGYLVSVTVDGDMYETALDVLDDEGTIDIDERQADWRAEGWQGYQDEGRRFSGVDTRSLGGAATREDIGAGKRFGADAISSGSAAAGLEGTGFEKGETVVPVVEEQLRIGKRDTSHGRVRVRSYVVEQPVSEEVRLRDEDVTVERRPVDRPVSGEDRLFQDRSIEVEEHREEAVVAKEARVKEEVVVKKQVGERVEQVSDTVRRTKVEVEDDRGSESAKRRKT